MTVLWLKDEVARLKRLLLINDFVVICYAIIVVS